MALEYRAHRPHLRMTKDIIMRENETVGQVMSDAARTETFPNAQALEVKKLSSRLSSYGGFRQLEKH
jgi:hypothetical protein